MSRWRKWWLLGWVWRFGRLRLDVCPSNFNRPLLEWYRDGRWRGVSVGWGNGNSDPAFSLEVDLSSREERAE